MEKKRKKYQNNISGGLSRLSWVHMCWIDAINKQPQDTHLLSTLLKGTFRVIHLRKRFMALHDKYGTVFFTAITRYLKNNSVFTFCEICIGPNRRSVYAAARPIKPLKTNLNITVMNVNQKCSAADSRHLSKVIRKVHGHPSGAIYLKIEGPFSKIAAISSRGISIFPHHFNHWIHFDDWCWIICFWLWGNHVKKLLQSFVCHFKLKMWGLLESIWDTKPH